MFESICFFGNRVFKIRISCVSDGTKQEERRTTTITTLDNGSATTDGTSNGAPPLLYTGALLWPTGTEPEQHAPPSK